MKVTAILKGKIDSNGHRPVYIRINEGQKRIFHTTRIKVDPKLFENGKIKSAHPQARQLNKTIETLILQYQAGTLNKPKVPKVKLMDYINTCLNQWENLVEDGTYDKDVSIRNVLRGFRPKEYLTDINVAWLYDLQAWRLTQVSHNTMLNTLKFVRKIVLKAKSEGLVTENPFERGKFKMPVYKPPKKVYLTKDEVERIERFVMNKSTDPVLRHVGTWFLIGCATGLRISDLRGFKPSEHIVNGRIILYPEKAQDSAVVSIPFNKRIKTLFERIEYKPLGKSGQKYNPYLKAIAAAVGIKKNMASHIARHTMAMHMADSGISMEVAAAVLGHKDQRSTQVYYKISGKRIDAEMKKIM